MKRWTIGMAALAVATLCAVAPPAKAATSVDFSVHIGDRYRGASLEFHSQPDVVLVPATKVYYVRDYGHDLYRYGRYWYFVERGHWYRARSWKGPFVHLYTRSVPRAVRTVPLNYRRNWNGPPSHAVAHGLKKAHKHKVHKHKKAHKRYLSKERHKANKRYVKAEKRKAKERSVKAEKQTAKKRHKRANDNDEKGKRGKSSRR